MNKISEEQRKKLREPLPPEAISKHPTKTYLSSIKAIYVTERLNDVFGIGSWQLRSEVVERAEGGTVVTKTTLTIPEYNVHLESFGGNDNGGDNNKNFDLGDAFKGSVTDAVTKICSYLEIGIDVFKGKGGNKTGTGIAENKTQEKKKTAAPKIAETPKPTKLEALTEQHKSWNYVKDRVKSGVPISTIEKSFILSEEIKKKLESN